MKKRIFWLIYLSLLCVLVLSGCRCKPFETQWYVQSYEKYEVYVNGAEYTLAHSGYPSLRDPFAGMADGLISISFREDGSVVFRPGAGEVLAGTYTYKHNGLRDTTVSVTLDNGESFNCTASSNSYGSSLMFTFRDNDYLFESIKKDPQDHYDQNFQELCESIRYWCREGYGDVPVQPCTIQKTSQDYALISDTLDNPIRLDSSVVVRCFLLDANDTLHAMDAIGVGECFFAAETLNDITYVTLYYVEIA